MRVPHPSASLMLQRSKSSLVLMYRSGEDGIGRALPTAPKESDS